MSRMGKADFSQLENFNKKIKKQLNENECKMLIEKCAKRAAAMLLTSLIDLTLPGQYPPGSGKVGGTLRRGWSIGNVEFKNGTFSIEVINPVEYASYVEYGHRTRNHKGWVEGKFIIPIAKEDVEKALPKEVEQIIFQKLKEAFK